MKIAICQINSRIGDFENNSKKIIQLIKKAETAKCEIAIFPELCVSGYPPMDLIQNKSFIEKNNYYTDKIIKSTNNIIAILGDINNQKKDMFNSAIVINKKKIIFVQNKTLLPNYDVFDEQRYFTSNNRFSLCKIKNFKIGILICEDIWFHEYKYKYKINPVEQILQIKKNNSSIKPDLIIIISASPFEKNKLDYRINICKKYFLKLNIPVFYVNSAGGQDELIFDGSSFYINNASIFLCKRFDEDFKIIDTDRKYNEFKYFSEIEEIYFALILGIKDYFSKCGFKKAIIGLSGGIDSAVVAALAVEALGKNNVIGVLMPSIYSAKSSAADAVELSKNLGIKYFIIKIDSLFKKFLYELKQPFENMKEDITEENIQSRIRGNLLMAIANKYNGLVLATGNKSELSMGYCTLYGDLIGGLAVIGDLLKRDVYEIGRLINSNKNIIPKNIFIKAPSAELRPNQKDEDTLPPYKILDEVLHLHIEKGLSKEEIIIKGFDKNTVYYIFNTLYKQEYKRKQAPTTLKISAKTFGIGRRIPITNKFY